MEVTLNGKSRQIDEGLTVAALLDQLHLADKFVAVEINLDLVPRAQHAKRVLADGDRLEIVTLVGGG